MWPVPLPSIRWCLISDSSGVAITQERALARRGENGDRSNILIFIFFTFLYVASSVIWALGAGTYLEGGILVCGRHVALGAP